MLQVPNAAAQLMVDPLLGNAILCLEGGVRGDVFRRCFGPNDFFRKQVKAERKNKEEVKREITQESKKQVQGELTLKSCVSLERCLPWAACLCHGLGVFSSGAGEKMRGDG
jgi:hypothetical protein